MELKYQAVAAAISIRGYPCPNISPTHDIYSRQQKNHCNTFGQDCRQKAWNAACHTRLDLSDHRLEQHHSQLIKLLTRTTSWSAPTVYRQPESAPDTWQSLKTPSDV
jgi:hypothetical protein